MYAKRGGVAAYLIVWIGFCLRGVPGVRVLPSAVDDSSTALATSLKLSNTQPISSVFSYQIY